MRGRTPSRLTFTIMSLLEPARTDESGLQVKVARRPISTGVYTRANHFSQRCSSAVRGVWDNPEKKGRNYYSRPCRHLDRTQVDFLLQAGCTSLLSISLASGRLKIPKSRNGSSTRRACAQRRNGSSKICASRSMNPKSWWAVSALSLWIHSPNWFETEFQAASPAGQGPGK